MGVVKIGWFFHPAVKGHGRQCGRGINTPKGMPCLHLQTSTWQKPFLWGCSGNAGAAGVRITLTGTFHFLVSQAQCTFYKGFVSVNACCLRLEYTCSFGSLIICCCLFCVSAGNIQFHRAWFSLFPAVLMIKVELRKLREFQRVE